MPSRGLTMLQYADAINDAAVLLRYGERSNNIMALTGLSGPDVIRLGKEVSGKSPKSGQQAFSDYWFAKDRVRMYHASLIHNINRKFAKTYPKRPAHRAIKVYETYLSLVGKEKSIPIRNVLFVEKLVEMGQFTQKTCKCKSVFLVRVNSPKMLCYSCEQHERMHCLCCGDLIQEWTPGTRKRFCDKPECCTETYNRRLGVLDTDDYQLNMPPCAW